MNPEPLTPERIAELERLEKAATQGQWDHLYFRPDVPSSREILHIPAVADGVGVDCRPHMIFNQLAGEDDAEFVAALRNASPALFAAAKRAKRLEEALNRIVDLGTHLDSSRQKSEVARAALAEGGGDGPAVGGGA